MSHFKLHSWNVNGFRSVLRKGFMDYIESEKPDILCLQETRIDDAALQSIEEIPLLADSYHMIWNHAEKKGYSGTAIFSKKKPLEIARGFEAPDPEGRVLVAEYSEFFLLSVYAPNSQRELVRLPYRTLEWDPSFRAYVAKLARTKAVIFCGDMNVAHEEIDLANPKSNRRNSGFTDEERANFTLLLGSGFVDTFRNENPGKPHQYSWWSQRQNVREKNIGWRIDYFCISEGFLPHIRSSRIRSDVYGSDHCPVELIVKTW